MLDMALKRGAVMVHKEIFMHHA